MQRIFWIFMLWLATTVFAADGQSPHRIVLTWQNDPATTQSVSWRTIDHISNARAQISPVSDWAKDFADHAETVKAIPQDITTDDKETFTHYHAEFTDLAPGARYAYRVGSKKGWSEWNLFRTAGPNSDAFTFNYLGDIQNDIHEMVSPLLRKMALDTPDSRFILIAGDLVNRGKNDSDWADFFSAFGFIPRTIPLVPVLGNHDSNKAIEDEYGNRTPDPLYLAHFALPANKTKAEILNKVAYTLDYQSARIVVFNTNTWQHKEQLQWLESVLKSNTRPWLLVSFHHPVYSTGRDRNNKEMRATLAPLFEKYGVDLVLQGHDHFYGRTAKILQNNTAPGNAQAPVYVVSVSGPKMYDRNTNFSELMQVQVGETQLYQAITISPHKLEFISKNMNGDIIDAFKLIKQNQGSVLVDKKKQAVYD